MTILSIFTVVRINTRYMCIRLMHLKNYLNVKLVTYKEDKDYVVKSFARLIGDAVYQKDLFEDFK